MQIRTAISPALLFLTVIALTACSSVLSGQASSSLWSRPAEIQSINGRISAIGDAEFSVEIGKSKKAEPVRFLIDENTKVEGRLTVGSQVSVEYHTDGGNNVAVHVIVAPPRASFFFEEAYGNDSNSN